MDELKGVEQLFEKNLVPVTRLKALQRDAAQLRGERGEIVAAIAQAKGKIAETELQTIQLDQDLRTEVLQELREIEGQAGELIERKVAAEDELRRVAIRSPQDGVVHELSVHTVGGVIGPGETLMFIVPEKDALAIEARVAPQDIDQVVLGRPAVVRLSAFNQRTTPELLGTTARISADVTEDPEKGLAYYTTRIELSQSELLSVDGLKLVPGMPAEVHIRTGERTALSYLLKPLTDQFAKAFREE
jgi:HlyD family secretion protein